MTTELRWLLEVTRPAGRRVPLRMRALERDIGAATERRRAEAARFNRAEHGRATMIDWQLLVGDGAESSVREGIPSLWVRRARRRAGVPPPCPEQDVAYRDRALEILAHQPGEPLPDSLAEQITRWERLVQAARADGDRRWDAATALLMIGNGEHGIERRRQLWESGIGEDRARAEHCDRFSRCNVTSIPWQRWDRIVSDHLNAQGLNPDPGDGIWSTTYAGVAAYFDEGLWEESIRSGQ